MCRTEWLEYACLRQLAEVRRGPWCFICSVWGLLDALGCCAQVAALNSGDRRLVAIRSDCELMQ